MKASEKRRLIVLTGAALSLLTVATLGRRPASDLIATVQAYAPAFEAQAALVRTRTLLQLPTAAQRGEPATHGSDGEVAGSTGTARALGELDGLVPLLSVDPDQRRTLQALRELLQREGPAGAPGSADVQRDRAAQVERLLAALEQGERARARRLDDLSSTALHDLALIAAASGAGVVVFILVGLSLTLWEGSRRRVSARLVARLKEGQRRLAERLSYLDRCDPLTGLPNRRRLGELLEQAIVRARAGGHRLAVLVTDIDRLKHVNDLFGVEAGDEALQQVARRLRGLAGEQGIVGRLAGGEFVMALLDPAPDAAARAEQIRRVVSRSIVAGENDFVVTSTTGIAYYPEHGQDAQTLIRNADLALVKARSMGRNTIQVFDDQIKEVVSELFLLERRLNLALSNHEYLVHYQPCCDLTTSQVAGAEALVKWRNADVGMIPAAKFIPVLEDSGMIVEVGKWVLDTACRQLKAWETRDRRFPVSVNLSLVQFRDRYLVEMVADAISAFKLDPGRLTLEVTESICLKDMEFAIRTLKRLKDMGVSLSVDDFGTGYSSLSYLKRLPVDSVKIDISFVRDVTTDQDAVSIVTAITSLARSLNLKTVAEGVETEEQRRMLHLLRCDLGQGFLFSPALPAAQLEAFAAQDRGPAANGARAG